MPTNSIKKFSIIIPLKIESEYRKINFEKVIHHLTDNFPDQEIIIVGHSSNPYAISFFEFNKNINYYLVDQEFSKCLYCNIGARLASTNILCFYDSDCIVQKVAMEASIHQIANEGKILVYPFRQFFPLNLKQTNLFFTSNSIPDFENTLRENIFAKMAHEINETASEHPGGIQIFNRRCFDAVNGYNENLSTWGGDDVEILNKIIKKFGDKSISYSTTNLDCYHLYHSRPESRWNSTFMHIEKGDLINLFFSVIDENNFDRYLENQNINIAFESPTRDLLMLYSDLKKQSDELKWNILKTQKRMNKFFEQLPNPDLCFAEFVENSNKKLYLNIKDQLSYDIKNEENLEQLKEQLFYFFHKKYNAIEKKKENIVSTINQFIYQRETTT